MRRMALSVLLALSTILAGCFSNGESLVEEETIENIWTEYVLIDEQQHENPKE